MRNMLDLDLYTTSVTSATEKSHDYENSTVKRIETYSEASCIHVCSAALGGDLFEEVSARDCAKEATSDRARMSARLHRNAEQNNCAPTRRAT